MSGGLLVNCDEKNIGFSTPFKAVLDTKNAIGLNLWRVIPLRLFIKTYCKLLQLARGGIISQ